MKETQYSMILRHLRKAGNKGATIRELQAYSNYPWSRIGDITSVSGTVAGSYRYKDNSYERIERHERLHNGRKIRVYVLKRVK